MNSKRFTEQELLENLDAQAAHADELAQLLPQEITVLERLRGSVKNYDRPLDGCWDGDMDSGEEKRCTDDVSERSDQPDAPLEGL